MKQILFALQLGIEVIGTIVFCLMIGWYIDCYFQTQPIAMIVMIGLAFIYVMKLLIGVYRRG